MGKKTIKVPTFNFTTYFNKSDLSDITILVNNKEIKYDCHKLILKNGSTFFEKNIKEDKSTFTFDEEDKLVNSFLLFLYGGNYDFTNEDDLLSFILFLKKVKII
jgi:hypothetical protein